MIKKKYTIVLILIISLLFILKSECRETRRYKRIVGGEIVLNNEIKYQASIRYDGLYICAGTIISSKHILTAAHCFVGLDLDFTVVTVVTGTTKLYDKHNEHNEHKEHSVFNITWHEDFVNGADHNNFNKNDIAVITLDDEIIFDDSQEAALLPDSPTPEQATGIVCGWGREDQNNDYPSKVLKKIQVQVINRQECQEKIKFNLYQGQFCGIAGSASGFCKGDSGGSLVVDKRVIGFASWNDGCAKGKPDVYTDVYENLNFINKAMKLKTCTKYRAPGC